MYYGIMQDKSIDGWGVITSDDGKVWEHFAGPWKNTPETPGLGKEKASVFIDLLLDAAPDGQTPAAAPPSKPAVRRGRPPKVQQVQPAEAAQPAQEPQVKPQAATEPVPAQAAPPVLKKPVPLRKVQVIKVDEDGSESPA